MKGLHFHPSPSLPSTFETESTQMRGAFESINAILISTIHATKQLMSLGPLSMSKCMGMEARNFSSIRSAFTYVYLVSVPIFGLFRCGFFFSFFNVTNLFLFYLLPNRWKVGRLLLLGRNFSHQVHRKNGNAKRCKPSLTNGP